MNSLLIDLESFQSTTSKEEISDWLSKMQKQIKKLTQKEQSHYYILVSEVYATKMGDVDAAFDVLGKVQLKDKTVIEEYKLREIYFRFLEGDYQQALKEFSIIESECKENNHYRKAALDFFKRIVDTTGKTKEAKGSKQQYQKLFLKGIECSRNSQYQQAMEIQKQLYSRYEHLGANIKYEAAKQMVSLNDKLPKSSRQNVTDHKTFIINYEKKLTNKDYYKDKIKFISNVMSFIEANDDIEEPEKDHQIMREYMIQQIEKLIDGIKDKDMKLRISEVLIGLRQEDKVNPEICYKFLGEDIYKKLLKAKQVQISHKKKKVKDTSIKPTIIKAPTFTKSEDFDNTKKSNIKQTDSNMLELDPNFQGSDMIKVNMNSQGHEKRYFYIKRDFKQKLQLFYCSKSGKQSDDDNYYRLKGAKKIDFGKRSVAFQRKECDKFPQDQCITLVVAGEDEDYERNFYIPDRGDYQNWKNVFKSLLQMKKRPMESQIKKTYRMA